MGVRPMILGWDGGMRYGAYCCRVSHAVIMGDSLCVVLAVAAVEFGAGEHFGLAASFWIGLALSR